jgi:L-ascorbate metabolism protein UlaG (beta-lactamase superfamily)
VNRVTIAVTAAILSTILSGGSIVAAGEVSVRSLANDAVLVWNGTTRVVVDFPFAGRFDWCVSPTETQIQALLERQPPFESVDVFLFTHDHVDHFDPVLTAKALEAHPRAVLVGTTLVLQRVREAGGGRLKSVSFEALEGNAIETAGLKIQVLKAPHARYWDIDPATGKQVTKDDGYVHRAYLVTMAGISFLHGGDAVEIALPDEAAADFILLDRGILRAKGMEFLSGLHRRLGARRTALTHAGPAEFATLKSLVEKESVWLSAVTERDQVLSIERSTVRATGARISGESASMS